MKLQVIDKIDSKENLKKVNNTDWKQKTNYSDNSSNFFFIFIMYQILESNEGKEHTAFQNQILSKPPLNKRKNKSNPVLKCNKDDSEQWSDKYEMSESDMSPIMTTFNLSQTLEHSNPNVK